jgi:tRNA pseudouridine38-40 synthase
VRNIKLIIAFDGTEYFGWQRQKSDPTIQGIVEEAIAKMTCTPVTLNGAGRTDAGVHAEGMVANFTTDSAIDPTGFLNGLNSILPDAVRLRSVEEVDEAFHARFSAKGKEYEYHFVATDIASPLERLYVARIPASIDLEAMRACMELLVGEHDFSSFEATGSRDLSISGGRGAIRTIFHAELVELGEKSGRLKVVLAGDGFLRHMVRNIVGTLFDVGKGRLSLADFESIIAAKDRTGAGATAPANGLLLKKVFY